MSHQLLSCPDVDTFTSEFRTVFVPETVGGESFSFSLKNGIPIGRCSEIDVQVIAEMLPGSFGVIALLITTVCGAHIFVFRRFHDDLV